MVLALQCFDTVGWASGIVSGPGCPGKEAVCQSKGHSKSL